MTHENDKLWQARAGVKNPRDSRKQQYNYINTQKKKGTQNRPLGNTRKDKRFRGKRAINDYLL